MNMSYCNKVFYHVNEAKQSDYEQLCESSMEQKYEILDVLGEGSFGFVVLARCRATGKSCAIK